MDKQEHVGGSGGLLAGSRRRGSTPSALSTRDPCAPGAHHSAPKKESNRPIGPPKGTSTDPFFRFLNFQTVL